MKKIYYMLLMMVAAMTAMAQDLPKTEMPYIQFCEDRHYYDINVFGDGTLNVQVAVREIYDSEEVIIVEGQAEFNYDYRLYRMPPYHWCVVRATAQADGCLPSDTIEEIFPIQPYAFMPVPEIIFNEVVDGLYIDVQIDGEGDLYGTLWINNETSTIDDFPVFVPRTYEVQEIGIWVECYDSNDPDMYPSESFDGYTLAPYETPPVPEQTSAPIFNIYTNEDYSRTITICETEPSTIYYRIGVVNESNTEFIFNEWVEYMGELVFDTEGIYRIEAYAIAEGKSQSATVACEFMVDRPTPTYIYDFEEAGVFYKITAEGEVSVCSETTDYNSYSGKVDIPATVTHDGVTYMVTGIQENAFRDCEYLADVTIGAYVTAIGDNAFESCTSLTSVTLGDYVITIGCKAFAGCTSLTSIKLGSGLTSIGSKAFEGCNALTSVTCKAATPPVMAASNCFDCYAIATLHVYPAVLRSYRATNYWNQFANIVAEDTVAPDGGDVNGDGRLNISDVTALINRLLNMP